MYLFNKHENGFNQPDSPTPDPVPVIAARRKPTLMELLTGEEQPRSIGSLCFILMALLHLWLAIWLMKPGEPIILAKPLMMEVSMISAPGVKPSALTPAPPKPIEPVAKPIKKPEKKPIKKKAQKKQQELPKPTTTPEELVPAPSQAESVSEVKPTSNATTTPPVNNSKSVSTAEPYIEASFNANYGSNPKPRYPDTARSRGWEGKVLLRVSVTAEGLSESVTVYRSSGHDVLDESAVAAVEKWRFTPAKRGDTNVACSVIVPIIFTLNY
jgi:periplasmic protein TonB